MILLLLGCTPLFFPSDPGECDPRVLEKGEVRVRRIPCSDELISRGEARVGDYLLENALARYTVRGTYGALSRLQEEGGTLLDAAIPGGTDLLMELIPQGDRSSITMVEEEDAVRLDLPGVQYRLRADSPILEVEAEEAILQPRPGAERVGATLRSGSNFFGAEGEVSDRGGYASILGLSRVSVERDALWEGQEFSGEVDADTVLVLRDSQPLLRLPVEEGQFRAVLPEGVQFQGEREGCRYDGLTLLACGSLQLRLVDGTGEDISGQLSDGQQVWRIPKGGGVLPVGPDARVFQIWGGPAFSTATLTFPGGDDQRTVTLQREIPEGPALAVLDVVAAPDADVDEDAWDQLGLLGGAGVDYAVVVADDEVPGAPFHLRDSPWAEAGSRVEGLLWSWPWVPTYKKSAHGAVPWQGLSALDLLALSHGRTGDRRLTVVTPTWIQKALSEQPPRTWVPVPDALRLDGLQDLPLLLQLLDQWVDITPVGPYTWLQVGPTRNLAAYQKALVDGQTVASNGPLLDLRVSPAPEQGRLTVVVTVEAPRWMGPQSLTLMTPLGEQSALPDEEGRAIFQVPASVAYVLATSHGIASSNPWIPGETWAVSSPVWLR